jgi:3-oxoacyl-[acyl-carrier protein] reductase
MVDREVVLVTGTTRGIGRHLAEHFLGKGALVEGCGRQPAGWHAPGYTHHVADVGDEAQVRAMLADIRRRHGRLDVAINNAGVAAMNHALLTPGAAVDRVMATNVRGTFLVARESAKVMKTRQYGRIVNMGSVATPLCLEGEAIYAASKAAVVSLTQVLAREFAEYGITCNTVGPSPLSTDLIRAVPADKIQAIVDRLAVKRLAQFEDVANVVDFFVSPASGYVTGQVIYLGGVAP